MLGSRRMLRRMVDASSYLAAMGKLATGVTVVGASGDGSVGEWTAQTVSAMCSVSAEPPILLACVHERSPLVAAVTRGRRFCVSALATHHDHVADTFAGRPWPGKDRWDFSCGDWTAAPSGSPRLVDPLAWFDCELHDIVRAGTHHVLLGRVTALDVAGSPGAAVPLLYADRDYARPARHEPSSFPNFPDAHPANRLGARR
ncbi:flavin reductase [Pseudonocardia eucalypti]|uniref:Flavin reductase n=2 Tax=Pseudonocardia eucalypti TaxID=648755 RepID=A0ABP9QTD3_9PSEU